MFLASDSCTPLRQYRRGVDGQDIVNLRSLYVKGEKAPFTHAHYRRFAIGDIPLHDPEAFDAWLYERWAEKAELLEHFHAHGQFPAQDGYVQSRIKLRGAPKMIMMLLFACGIAMSAAWLATRCLYSQVTATYA